MNRASHFLAPLQPTFTDRLIAAGVEAANAIGSAYRDGGPRAAVRSLGELAYWRLDPRVRRWYKRRAIESAIDREFDEMYGVETSAEVSLVDLGLDKSAAHEGNGVYRAVWNETFRAAIEALPTSALPIEEATFVDYGSGKGKALLLASAYAFKKIVGVEYAEALCEIAARNVERFPETQQKCREIELICGDARDFELPAGPVICFFFNPFTEEVWRTVLARLTDSWQRNPRPMRLIYVNPRNTRESKNVFRNAGPFVRVARGADFEIYAAR